MAGISPRVDIAFKKIFGVEENKDLLISLINSMMSQQDQVASIELLNPYNVKNFLKDKLSVLDIKAKSIDGRLFNIEIQVADEADYDKRALYYWARLYTEQLQESNDYSTLSKAIGIHILNFVSIPNAKKYHNVFHIREKETGLTYFEDLELHTVELKKFASDYDQLSDLVNKIKTSLDAWLAFLTRHDLLNKDDLPKELNDENIKKALTILEVMNFTAEERSLYQGRLDWLRIEASAFKKQRDKGRAEGIEIGKAEGITLGEENEKIKIAKKLKKLATPVETITEVTGLPIEKINKL